ncbi:Ribbon-helix-helix protein, copG family [Atopomonas hussainii]|uniref:Ribbon-helix-helix protein, copG family n=1 Tax=Atopomonas hussainii TaxID=1429083 RepID=A0A1H7MIR6_9GAMM|nr:ribbon-helix-helix protein, CopG family [Atopomonas hussainii]SEL11210.1 Ribbon-helix-helix protein, copG family [Atopomonas hussainii]
MRDELARRLKQHYFSASDIRKAQDTHLVNEKNLKWITDDKRQLQWLEPHIVNFTNYPNQPDLTNLSKRELLIARVDVLDVSLERKCSELLLLKNEWNKWTEEDGIYDWFKDKKEGEQRLACARHWIEKQPIEWRGFQKASNLSTLEDLIIFFDHKCGNWFERKAAISEIRKRWNKKNFDAKNKHKRQINVMLTTDAIGQLDQLCRESNSSRAKIIEELIRGHKQTAKQPL